MGYKFEHNRIYLEQNGMVKAEITFPDSKGVATIEHTYVDESLRGMGIGSELVEMAVEMIHRSGWELQVKCPYAKKWIEQNQK